MTLRHTCFQIVSMLFVTLAAAGLPAADRVGPAKGDQAKAFTLPDLDGHPVRWKEDRLGKGPVVLVVVRGYPGYHCPVCTRQFSELLANAKKFSDARAKVVLIYPGSKKDLQKHAADFVASRPLPDNFVFLLDADFEFTNLYGLRWMAPGETAYPASFVVDPSGKIQFAKVSQSHGGRSTVAELLANIPK